MKRLRLFLARLLLPRGWVVAPQAYLSYTTERFISDNWPSGTLLHTVAVSLPRADTLTQEQISPDSPRA